MAYHACTAVRLKCVYITMALADADEAVTELVHVRFTFDRTPFRRMLRALRVAGVQAQTMQLLPPQVTNSESVPGDLPCACITCLQLCGRIVHSHLHDPEDKQMLRQFDRTVRICQHGV